MQKRIALLYDFDYTLAHGFMQQFGLMQEFGYSDVYKYFDDCEKVAIDPEMDMCLSMLCGIKEMADKQGKKVTAKRLYLETMEDVLSKSDTVIIDPSAKGSNVLPILPINK